MRSDRIPPKKLLASAPKFLAAGYIAKFQISPRLAARSYDGPPAKGTIILAELVYDKTGRLLFTKEMKKEYTILVPQMLPEDRKSVV